MSKISDYQFEKQVRDLQAQGKSIRKIAEILNKQIPADDEPISEMAVSRWIRADKKQLPMINVPDKAVDESDNPESLTIAGVQASEDVNPYEETIKLINDCDYQIEILKKRVERTAMVNIGDSKKSSIDPQSLLAQYISRKQSLLQDIAMYQKDLSNYAKVKETLKIVFDTLKEVSPESYEQFKKEVRDKQGITNIMR